MSDTLTIREVAVKLRLKESTIWRLILGKKLEARIDTFPKRHWVVTPAALARYIMDNPTGHDKWSENGKLP